MLAWTFVLGLGALVVGYFHVRQYMHFFSMTAKYRLDVLPTPRQSAEEFYHFVESFKGLSPTLLEDVKNYKDPFVRESTHAYLQGALRGSDYLRGLRQNAEAHYEHEVQNARNVVMAAKMLPVIGWLAAIGATVWLLNVDSGMISFSRLTTAFTVLMVAITYGMSVSYFLLQPLANRILGVARRNRLRNAMIIEGFSHLMKGKSAYEIREAVQLVLPKYDSEITNWVERFPENVQEVA